MSSVDQLEIVCPDGSVYFYDLDPAKGITNIGPQLDSDIIVGDPSQPGFHIVVDHQRKPFRVMVLSDSLEARLDGHRVEPNLFQDMCDWQTLDLDGYSITCLQDRMATALAGPVAAGATAVQERPAVRGRPAVKPIGALPLVGVAPAVGSPAEPAQVGVDHPQIRVRPADEKDDFIVADISEREWTIDVEQAATCELTVANGGPIVATFDIAVEGINENWVDISPDRVNLNEGDRATVFITIVQNRHSTSTAGPHHLSFKITSPNYPGHVSRLGATLTINPYYEFTAGNLSPARQSVAWSKGAGGATFTIQNQGNSPARFMVMAQDDENGCKFEFPLVPGSSPIKQTEAKVNAGEALEVPLVITPLKRPMIRLKNKQYQYSVTTTSLDAPGSIWTLSGSLDSRPLFGLIHVLILALLILAVGFLILRPSINYLQVEKSVIRKGETALLKWSVSPFTTDLRIEGVADPIKGSQGQIATVPSSNATIYKLYAGNWLSRLFKMDDLASQPVTVLAIPPYPEIVTFFVDRSNVFQSDSITVKWSVRNADEASLTVEGVTESLKGDQLNGEKKVQLKGDTMVVLEAKNNSGTITRSEYVRARPINIIIRNFSVSPKEVVKGDPVTITWDIAGDGVESVIISPFKDPLPMTGSLQFFPESSMEFVLTVKARDKQEIRLLSVGVMDKIVPVAPTIDIFKAAPELLQVGGGQVEFAWSVSGQTTKIEINSQDGVLATDLTAQGFRTFTVNRTTTYIMTAYNNTLSNSKEAKVTVVLPKKDVYLTIKTIEPNTGVIIKGDSVLVYINIEAQNGTLHGPPANYNWPEISGKIVITDGYDTCSIDLPKRSCALTLNHAEATGDKKYIWATYQGDDNYGLHESEHLQFGGSVIGAPVSLAGQFVDQTGAPINDVITGQVFQLKAIVKPVDVFKGQITGTVEVRVGQTKTLLCTIKLDKFSDADKSTTGLCNPYPITLPVPLEKALKYTASFTYSGDAIYNGASATADIQITPSPTITAITNDLSLPKIVGETLTVAVKTIADPTSGGGGVPTGKVSVSDGVDSCEATLGADGAGSCQFVLTQATGGSPRNVTAIYNSDGYYKESHSVNPVPHVVNANSTIITIVEPNPKPVGEVGTAGSVTVRVVPANNLPGTPTGDILITQVNPPLNPSPTLCTITLTQLNNRVGTCSFYYRSAGTPVKFKATYMGSPMFNMSEMDFERGVNPAPTQITVAGLPDSYELGASKTVTYDVAYANANIKYDVVESITGQMVVQDNGTTICGPVEYPTNKTCTISFASAGQHQVSFKFTPTSGNIQGSTYSKTVTAKDGVKITLTNSTAPLYYGQPASFTVSAEGNLTKGFPTGTMVLTPASGNACSGSLVHSAASPISVYSCTITFTQAGSNKITINYAGDNSYSQVTQDVIFNVLPAPTAIQLPSGVGVTAQTPSPVTFKVVVQPSVTAEQPTGTVTLQVVNPISLVVLYTCQAQLVSSGAGSGSCDLVFPGKGPYTLRTTFKDSTGRFGDSSGEYPNITAALAQTQTAVHVSQTAPVFLEKVNFTVTVTKAVSNTVSDPTSGTVDVKADGSTICTVTLIGSNTGACLSGFNSLGNRNITATYNGDSVSFDISSSVTQTLTVGQANTTVVSSSPASIVYGQAGGVTFTATIQPNSPAGGIPDGFVNFAATPPGGAAPTDFCNSVSIDPGNGTATCIFTKLKDTVGAWTVEVSYSGSTNYKASALAPSASYQVNRADTITTIVQISPPGPFLPHTDYTVTVNVLTKAPGTGTPTGSISLNGNACNAPIIVNNTLVATCTYHTGASGTYTLLAHYPDDINFYGSDSAPVVINVP